MAEISTLPKQTTQVERPEDEMDSERKNEISHDEGFTKEADYRENVVDHYAAGYTNAELIIDEKENKRLRRMIHLR